MQTIQKLEIGFGIATSASVLLWLFLSIGSALSIEIEMREFLIWCANIIHIWLISLMVAVGAYYHATKRSRVAALVIAVGAISIMAISVFFTLFVMTYNHGNGKLALLVIAPAVFAFLTGIFAIAASE